MNIKTVAALRDARAAAMRSARNTPSTAVRDMWVRRARLANRLLVRGGVR